MYRISMFNPLRFCSSPIADSAALCISTAFKTLSSFTVHPQPGVQAELRKKRAARLTLR